MNAFRLATCIAFVFFSLSGCGSTSLSPQLLPSTDVASVSLAGSTCAVDYTLVNESSDLFTIDLLQFVVQSDQGGEEIQNFTGENIEALLGANIINAAESISTTLQIDVSNVLNGTRYTIQIIVIASNSVSSLTNGYVASFSCQ